MFFRTNPCQRILLNEPFVFSKLWKHNGAFCVGDFQQNIRKLHKKENLDNKTWKPINSTRHRWIFYGFQCRMVDVNRIQDGSSSCVDNQVEPSEGAGPNKTNSLNNWRAFRFDLDYGRILHHTYYIQAWPEFRHIKFYIQISEIRWRSSPEMKYETMQMHIVRTVRSLIYSLP